MTTEPVPRAGAGPEPVPGPAVAPAAKPKRPTPDQSWRAHHRELKAKWAPPPVAKFDYRGAMIAANRERNLRLAAAKRAEAQARAEEATRMFQGQVMPGFRPPAGKLWGVDVEALMIVGPGGGIGTTAVMARILAPLAAGGRHDESVIAAETGCRDAVHLQELLTAMAGKLAAVGLRVDRRRTGIRIAKVKPPSPCEAADTVQ